MKRANGSIKPVVAVVGLGLMGGSLGQALVRGGRWHVLGWGRNSRRLRQARGCAHELSSDLSRVGEASVVVICVPVNQVVPMMRRLVPFLSPGVLVMDVGSVKGPIVQSLGSPPTATDGPVFVGCHPLCGSEKAGAQNAQEDLFRGATCVITPAQGTPAVAVRRAQSFWREVGAQPLLLDPRTHDHWLALVSHLPHLLAFSLIEAVSQEGRSPRWIQKLIAGSFRDATRVAAADPDQWVSIFQMNRQPLQRVARHFQNSFSRLLNRPSATRLRVLQEWKKALTAEARP